MDMSLHQIGAGNRSGEYRPRENASGPIARLAGEQPNPHNPRKQREILAAAGSGETFLRDKWRRERDSRRTFSDKKVNEFNQGTFASEYGWVHDGSVHRLDADHSFFHPRALVQHLVR